MSKVFVVSCLNENGTTILNIFNCLEKARKYCGFLTNGHDTKVLCEGRLYIDLELGISYDIQEYLVIGSK